MIQTASLGVRGVPSYAETDVAAGQGVRAQRWNRIGVVALMLAAVFYVYEHEPEMYAGGARSGLREDRLLDQFVDDAASGSSDRKAALIAFGFFGVIAAYTCRDQPWNLRWGGVALLLLLAAWVTVSVSWAEESGISIRRLIATNLALAGALGVARMLRPDELVSAVLVTMAVMVSASFAIDIAAGARPWQSGYRFAGTLHANSQATYCGVLCLAAQSFQAVRGFGWAKRLGLIGGLAGIVLTKSRTGMLAVLFGLLVTKTVSLRSGMRWAFVAFAISMAALGVIATASIGAGERAQLREAVLMGRTEQAGSLTGRVPLWQRLSDYASKRPMTGYGYQGFWTAKRLDAIKQSEGWTLQSAHNSYLEITLQLGLFGLGVLLLLIAWGAWTLQRAFEMTHLKGYAFGVGMIGLGMVDSLLQSHFAELTLTTAVAVILVLNVMFFFPEPDSESEAQGLTATA